MPSRVAPGWVQGWRIVKTKYRHSAFDGEGARRFGGRWNRPGQAVVYTASSRSLAILEMLVHLDRLTPLPGYALLPVSLPQTSAEELTVEELPADWRSFPPPLRLTELGDIWLRSQRSLGLWVPSVVVPEERNLLINPRHPEAGELRIGDAETFKLDGRLL